MLYKLKKKRIYTGLKDNSINRKRAEKIKENLYLEILGLKENLLITRKNINQIFDKFISEREITHSKATISIYKLAYKSIIKNNITLDAELIEDEVIYFLKNSKVTHETKNIYVRTLSTFLNWLHEKGHIDKRINVKRKYYLKTKKQENKIFLKSEINQIVDYFNKIDEEFAILIKFLSLTGLRIGEALNLTWQQVRKNYIYLHNKVSFENEKIPINDFIFNLIAPLKVKNKIKVFRWQNSSRSRLNRRLNDALEKLNIEKDNRSFHELRKSFLYYLMKSEIPVNVAQKLMRHKNIRVTIDYYQKLDDDILQNSMNKLTEILK